MYSMMPQVEKNSTGIYEWKVKALEGKAANHDDAMVPVFTFEQNAAPPVCDSAAEDPDKACQAVKPLYVAEDALQNTAAVCVNNVCVFQPPLAPDDNPGSDDLRVYCDDPNVCDGHPERCQVVGNTDQITCNGINPDDLCGADQCCTDVLAGEKCSQFCTYDASANSGDGASSCQKYCSLFQSACPSEVFNLQVNGNGHVKSSIQNAIRNGDFSYLNGIHCGDKTSTIASMLGCTEAGCPAQIDFYGSSGELCSVTNTYQCPSINGQMCPTAYCTQQGGCTLGYCANGSGYEGSCSNSSCGSFGYSTQTGYCNIPSYCALKSGVSGGASSSSDIVCGCNPSVANSCGCGVCASDGTCSAPSSSSDVCFAQDKACQRDGNTNYFSCQAKTCSNCGDCGTCDTKTGICQKDEDASCICQAQSDGSFQCPVRECNSDSECGTCGSCNQDTGTCYQTSAEKYNCATESPDTPVCQQDTSGLWECAANQCEGGCGECGHCNLLTGQCYQESAEIYDCAKKSPETPVCERQTSGQWECKANACEGGCGACGECNLLTGQCNQKPAEDYKCATESPTTPVCQRQTSGQWECKALECPNDGDCGACGTCNPATGTCYQTSVDDYNCATKFPATPMCQANDSNQFECVAKLCPGGVLGGDDGCGDCGTCNLENGVCNPASGSQCGTGSICQVCQGSDCVDQGSSSFTGAVTYKCSVAN